MAYNSKYYHSGKLHTLRPKRDSVWLHICSDGTIVGFFQGNRGINPALDFQIKVLLEGENQTTFTPAHWDWVTDLIIKSHFFPNEIAEILEYYIDFYDNRCKPFSNLEERNNHPLITVNEISVNYSNVIVRRTLSIDALATLLELFCYCEKQNLPIAHQFRDALARMKAYCEGSINIVDVMHLVCSHF